MFCANCGNNVADGARFCNRCGAAIPTAAAQQPQGQQPQYQQPLNQTPALGMKWFKFLIYFGLFAGAILNAGSAIMLLTGAAYDGDAELVYAFFDGLQTLDILVGLCLLATAALGFYARFRLSGYRKNGPKTLNFVYLASAAIQLIYVIGICVVLPEGAAEYFDFSSYFVSIGVSVGMVSANTTYFKKRAELFVND